MITPRSCTDQCCKPPRKQQLEANLMGTQLYRSSNTYTGRNLDQKNLIHSNYKDVQCNQFIVISSHQTHPPVKYPWGNSTHLGTQLYRSPNACWETLIRKVWSTLTFPNISSIISTLYYHPKSTIKVSLPHFLREFYYW